MLNFTAIAALSAAALTPKLLALVDPRTPQGQLTWSGSVLLVWAGVVIWRRRRRQSPEVTQ